jgi:ABC-2 type transport system ATP-binding protein
VTAIIEAHGLVKTYGHVRALDGLDLEVRAGEVHGFLGPNGAGKTTTIRILLGLLRATAGRVRLFGGDPWAEATALHRRLAYVPGDVTLWPSLTGGEVIDLLGRLRGGDDRRRRAELLERFGLDPRRRCRTYSKGNRQKVALVAALASDAELLVFDEPTSGLDPLMEAVFGDTVAAERERGRTVLLSSHILSEVETLCDRVSIVRAGRTVEAATLPELRRSRRTVVSAELAAAPSGLDRLPGVADLEVDGARVSCRVEPEHLDGLLRALTAVGVRGLTSRPPSLEELFLAHYRDDRAAVTAGSPVGSA